MKKLLQISFLPLALLITAENGRQAINDTDTLRIRKTGINNRVKINTLVNYAENDTLSPGIKGEIIQTGENNRVEINTGRKATTRKQQAANSKHQKTKSKMNESPTNADLEGRHSGKEKQAPGERNQVTVKQTGKNNSAIIHTP